MAALIKRIQLHTVCTRALHAFRSLAYCRAPSSQPNLGKRKNYNNDQFLISEQHLISQCWQKVSYLFFRLRFGCGCSIFYCYPCYRDVLRVCNCRVGNRWPGWLNSPEPSHSYHRNNTHALLCRQCLEHINCTELALTYGGLQDIYPSCVFGLALHFRLPMRILECVIIIYMHIHIKQHNICIQVLETCHTSINNLYFLSIM